LSQVLSQVCGKGAQAGYGKRWFETLTAAIEVISIPLLDSEAIPKIGSVSRADSPGGCAGSPWWLRPATRSSSGETGRGLAGCGGGGGARAAGPLGQKDGTGKKRLPVPL
jgi:hypothetical protein